MRDRAEGWWSEQQIADDGLVWRIGPLVLYVHRAEGEWQVAFHEEKAEPVPEDWSVEVSAAIPPELGQVARFALDSAGDTVRLTPRPADRSVVARPRTPLHVLAGEETRFYVSAPVWVEVSVGQPVRRLTETPTRRLTDTWFGNTTLDGEIAYALKTHARTRLEHMPRAAFRVVTPVLIRNSAEDPLPLDRMNLPVPLLSIYRCERGSLWTEAVTLSRTEDEEMATFKVASGPPDEASGARKLGEPRRAPADHPLVRAFGRLLRPFQEED